MAPGSHKHLTDIYDRLSPTDQAALTSFAEFLLNREQRGETRAPVPAPAQSPASAAEIPEPRSIERPAEERVVAAVKRLSQTYFMLDKSKMLGVTSDLVTQHILQGREAEDVIDELEQVFENHYQQMKQDRDR